MAITVTLDTIQDSQIELYGNVGQSAVRTGIATGLPSDTTVMNPEDVLWAITSAEGMPAMGSAYPGRSGLFLTRLQVFGQASNYARFRLIYDASGGVPTSYIISVGSALSTFQTNMLPGAPNFTFHVGFDPTGISGSTSLERIPEDLLTISMLRPCRRISVTQLQYGELTVNAAASFARNVGKVNGSDWLSDPPGTWIVSAASSQLSRYASYFTRQIEALAQGTDRWIYYGVLKSATTGKYAGNKAYIQGVVSALQDYAYDTGVRYRNGVIRVDPYPTADLAALFGFDDGTLGGG